MDKSLLQFKGFRMLFVTLGVLSLLQGAVIILQAVWLAEAITLLFHGAQLIEALHPLFWFAGAFAVRHTLVRLSQTFVARFSEQTSEEMRMKLITRLFAHGPDEAAKSGSGKIVTLTMDGIQKIRTYMELFPPRMLDMIGITLPLLIAIYVMDFISGIILTVTMPILIGFFILLGFAARKMADKQWRSYQVLAHHFTDALRGLETLRFLGRSKTYAAAVENVSDRYRKATLRTLRVAFLSSFALDFFSTLSVAFTAVGLGLRLIEGGIGLQIALTVLLLAPEYFTPVRKLGTDYHASLDGKEALKEWQHWMQKGDERVEDDPVQRKQATQQSAHSDAANRVVTIELKSVQVTNEEGGLRLHDITATIGGTHRKIGIVGMSGSGKTTMLNVLSGFLQPTSGEIDVQGQPLDGLVKSAWQQEIAYIPQSPYIFTGTLAHNVRFYEPEIADERVHQVLEQVGLGSLVRSLPHGIHEQIGEGGRTVSGGQAHRIALARAIAGNRSVWLLDEPTAHLDIETELELKQTMLPLFDQRFVVLATHRLHWMKEMDWILVMHQGQLVEAGTHKQLMANKSYYVDLLHAVNDPINKDQVSTRERGRES